MFYRDNRLNAIHEGTTGIQSLDLIARKVPMNNMKGYLATISEMNKTIVIAKKIDGLNEFSSELENAVNTLNSTTEAVLKGMSTKNIDLVLANSVSYLSMFGHVIIAWLWLKQGIVASNVLTEHPHKDDEHFYQGKLQALQYFYRIELPQVTVWQKVLVNTDSTSFDMQPEWF
jgi:butyryl-CoA dehydrogenase